MGEIERKTSYFSSGQIKRKYQTLDGLFHGLVTSYYESGIMSGQRLYHKHQLHGECKSYMLNGMVREHKFYHQNKNITEEVKAVYPNVVLTHEERLLIVLQWGIPCIPVEENDDE